MSQNLKQVQGVQPSAPTHMEECKSKSMEKTSMKSGHHGQDSLLCFKAVVIALIIFFPFSLTGVIVYTTYSVGMLTTKYELRVFLLEKQLHTMNNIIQDTAAKQDQCNEILAKREYNTKMKQDRASQEIQAFLRKKKTTRGRDTHPQSNKERVRGERSATPFEKSKCMTADVTVYEEFRMAASSRRAGLTSDLGNWTCECCTSQNFAVREVDGRVKIQFKVSGVYMIRVQLTLTNLSTRVQLQLDINGESWRKCIYQGDRYATCVLSGVRTMQAMSHISLGSSNGPVTILHRVVELTHIEIVKLMNI